MWESILSSLVPAVGGAVMQSPLGGILSKVPIVGGLLKGLFSSGANANMPQYGANANMPQYGGGSSQGLGQTQQFGGLSATQLLPIAQQLMSILGGGGGGLYQRPQMSPPMVGMPNAAVGGPVSAPQMTAPAMSPNQMPAPQMPAPAMSPNQMPMPAGMPTGQGGAFEELLRKGY
jgi:hypothetical protein